MFILRTVLQDKTEANSALGKTYKLTKKGEGSNFDALMPFTEVNDQYKDEVFAIVSSEEGNQHIPLFDRNQYYIMTESGKTFANLSYK